MIKLSRALVLSKASATFPNTDPVYVISILDEYGTEAYERERERVQLAVLKLCEGDINRLQDLVNLAKTDYRDVLSPAEYPNADRMGLTELDKLDPQAERALKEKDLHQYLSWLQDTEEPDATGYEAWLQGDE